MQLHVNTESNTKKKSDTKNKRKMSSIIHSKAKVPKETNSSLENSGKVISVDKDMDVDKDGTSDEINEAEVSNILDIDNIIDADDIKINSDDILFEDTGDVSDINFEGKEQIVDNEITSPHVDLDDVEDVDDVNKLQDKGNSKLKNKRNGSKHFKGGKHKKLKSKDTNVVDEVENSKPLSLIDIAIYTVAGICLIILGNMASNLLVNLMVSSIIGG